MTNYLVSRVTKEIGDRSRIGFLLTSVNRRLPQELTSLRRDALMAGADGYTAFLKKEWIVEWFGAASRVGGSREAIALTQESSSRYYQRPDAGYLRFDPQRTSLSGWAGKAMLSKATGDWRPIVEVQAYSPGFETNDAGFMQRTDVISSHALMQWGHQRPTALFRERRVWFGAWNNRNFGGDTIERGFFADAFGVLTNYWTAGAALFVTPGSFSDRLTRGGPLVRTRASWNSDLSLGSDDRKIFNFSLSGHFEGNRDGSYVRSGGLSLNARPSSNLQISVSPYFTRSHDYTQYLAAVADPAAGATYGKRYLFADLEQRSFEIGTRADWTLTSKLSFQLYMQPFIASGDYHDVHALARARSADYLPYTGPAGDPDFNFRSVRASAVVRWEFRPGSALYVVWNENRADVAPLGDFRLRRDFRAIPTAPSHDVFLVKMTYWLPL